MLALDAASAMVRTKKVQAWLSWLLEIEIFQAIKTPTGKVINLSALIAAYN